MITFFSSGPKPILFSLADFCSLNMVRQGGQSRIYQGYLKIDNIKQQVMIKLYEKDEYPQACFKVEALILSHSQSPSIINMYGLLKHPEGLALVLKAESFTAARLIHEVKSGHALPLLVIRHIFYGLLDALKYIQSQMDQQIFPHGVIHGDISSQNIVFSQKGLPILIDFGAAIYGEPGQVRAFGIKRFLAPEHLRGFPGFSSDLYSVAAVLFELIMLRSFDLDKMTADFRDLSAYLGKKNHDLFFWLRACLAPSPWFRPPNAAVVLKNLAPEDAQEKAFASHYLANLIKNLA